MKGEPPAPPRPLDYLAVGQVTAEELRRAGLQVTNEAEHVEVLVPRWNLHAGRLFIQSMIWLFASYVVVVLLVATMVAVYTHELSAILIGGCGTLPVAAVVAIGWRWLREARSARVTLYWPTPTWRLADEARTKFAAAGFGLRIGSGRLTLMDVGPLGVRTFDAPLTDVLDIDAVPGGGVHIHLRGVVAETFMFNQPRRVCRLITRFVRQEGQVKFV